MIINGKEYYTVDEAAKISGQTRQAIHGRIKTKWKDMCELQTIGRISIYLIPKELIDNYTPRKYPRK